MKLGNNIYKFIKSLLADVTVQVRVGGSLSGTVEIENGTPKVWSSVPYSSSLC